MKTSAGPERVALRDGREVLLRPLRWRDLEEATRFANSLVRERAANPDLGILLDARVTVAEERKWLAGRLAGVESGDCFSVCAQAEGHIVGNCEVQRRGFKDERHVGVFGIAILPSYRHAGLGRKMMEKVLREAGDGGISIVELDVFSINKHAIRLYSSMGFVRAGRVPGKIRRGRRSIDDILMYRRSPENR